MAHSEILPVLYLRAHALLASLIPRPPLAAFFAAVENYPGFPLQLFSTAAKKAAREVLRG